MAHDQDAKRYPLSFTQEWFLTLDQGDDGGTFGRRFVLVRPLRITGLVDLAVLQGALDDVVARHELLRTVVVRDADPPYQQVFPPCPVPLEVRELPPVPGKSRDMVIQDLAYQTDTINAREVPLLRARLCRFDDRDSLLFLTVHHSASDAWSFDVILRDLGAFYVSRTTGAPAELPPAGQYREYAEWQRANATSTAEDGAPAYWRGKLHGAREFTIPNDHGHPASYSRPYSLHNHRIEADTIAEASALATASRTTVFSVLLSAYYVLAHQLTGATDLTIRAFTAGRDVEQFHNTMGLFLNCVPLRTEIGDCTSFRDILARAKETFIDTIAHELPVNVIEQMFPDFISSRDDLRTSQFIISNTPGQLGQDLVFPIAEGAREIAVRWLEEDGQRDIPSGTVWFVDWPSDGTLLGGIMFNPEEFQESTVAGWTAGLRRILATAARDPDQNWKTL
ncbi:MAG: condensation domain-containing protein [Actinomycetota bacterium]|nr:condensation domain-containing protein [Actinomycetota bacterium]